jgi:hypothetical protein
MLLSEHCLLWQEGRHQPRSNSCAFHFWIVCHRRGAFQVLDQGQFAYVRTIPRNITVTRRLDTVKTTLKYPGLQHQPHAGARQGWVVHTIRRFLRAQFGQPAGFWGNIAGKIMARAPSNQERIQWTLALLAIKPDDRILAR